MPKNWIYLNNEIILEEKSHLSPFDRGFLLGDGIFETLRSKESKILFFEEHWQRLKKSAEAIHLLVPFEEQTIEKIIQDLLIKNQLSDTEAVIRLTLSRGKGSRGLGFEENAQPTLTIITSLLSKPNIEKYSLKVSSIRRNEYSPLSQIKSLNYLDNILAYRDAQQSGATDALICNTAGQMVCTARANLFFMIQGELFTAPVSAGVLPGITRQVFIKQASEQGIVVNEVALPISALCEVEKVFVTNTLLGVQPVYAIQNVGWIRRFLP